ncbi:hypothetical protein EZS27_018114 [termite gut metagenome]|uniref:Uncharacterized protein n=1 Tax=termite gut metagenome TaxID=433724 RepID=A0A5J4RIL3_9ZZZZ
MNLLNFVSAFPDEYSCKIKYIIPFSSCMHPLFYGKNKDCKALPRKYALRNEKEDFRKTEFSFAGQCP